MSIAEDVQRAAEIGLDHYRESTLLCFRAMTDGLPKQYRKQAREIIRFFEESTTPEVWQRLTTIRDPDNPTQSIADSWVAQWEQLNAAVGAK